MDNGIKRKKALLRTIPLFADLKECDLAFLANVTTSQDIPKGTVLINEGENSRSLYIVLSGKANAVGSCEEKKIVLNTFRAGDYFGEMSFLDGEPRCASVEMEKPGRVLIVNSDKFREKIASNPDFILQIAKGLLLKLRNATEHIENLEFIMGHQDLYDAHIDTIKRLVLAAECKDGNTGNHVIRVGQYSYLIADGLGLDDNTVQMIRCAAPMHDIGKIGIPREILQKKGRLTKKEFKLIKTHTTIGARILSEPKSDILKCAYDIALYHHERFDGKGYPHKLSAEAIPVSARIVGLADVFDALVSKRAYKKAFPFEKAFDIICCERGKHFDPDITDVFIGSIEHVIKIMTRFGSCDKGSLLSMNDYY